MQPALPPVQTASTGELVSELVRQTGDLVKAELSLARTELRHDVQAELSMVARAAVAVVCVLWAVDALLVAAVLGLAVALPAWLAALIVAAGLLAVALVAGLLAWSKRTRPLSRTARTLQENVRWAKQRLA